MTGFKYTIRGHLKYVPQVNHTALIARSEELSHDFFISLGWTEAESLASRDEWGCARFYSVGPSAPLIQITTPSEKTPYTLGEVSHLALWVHDTDTVYGAIETWCNGYGKRATANTLDGGRLMVIIQDVFDFGIELIPDPRHSVSR